MVAARATNTAGQKPVDDVIYQDGLGLVRDGFWLHIHGGCRSRPTHEAAITDGGSFFKRIPFPMTLFSLLTDLNVETGLKHLNFV